MKLAAMVIALSVAACSPQLRSAEAPPNFPVEGLWIQDTAKAGEDHFTILWVEKSASKTPGAAPYIFSFVRTVARNLAWNDQTLFVTRRTGDLRTSGKEVLLSQQVYLSSKRSVLENVKGKQIWPANQFGPEEDQRKIEDGYNLDLLELSEDGNTLSGKTGTFYRGNASGFGRFPQAVVCKVDRDNKEVALYGLPTGKFATGQVLKNAKGDISLRATGQNAEYVSATIEKGLPVIGDVVLPSDAKEDPKMKPLSKEEVLERIRRGEFVPRDDLIRVLGDKK